MTAFSLRAETKYLRGFAKYHFGETAFEAEPEEYMRRHGISIPDVHQVLRRGTVTGSEKEDACGAFWEVEGKTVDDIPLRVWLEVYCDLYRVNVLRVRMVELKDD